MVKIVGREAVAEANAPVFGLAFVGTSVAVQGGVPHAENKTVPVGPTPLLCVVIVAVNVTVCVVVTVARSLASPVTVGAFVTVRLSVISALAL